MHPAANILEVSLRHEHLLSKHHPLASLRRALHCALLDVEDGQHPVLADAEEQGIVEVDPHPRHWTRVAPKLLELLALASDPAAVQLVRPHSPRGRRGEEPSAAVGEPDAREGLGLGLAAVTAGPREGELLV